MTEPGVKSYGVVTSAVETLAAAVACAAGGWALAVAVSRDAETATLAGGGILALALGCGYLGIALYCRLRGRS